MTRDDLVSLWLEVDRLHDAGIAHGGLVAANIVVGAEGPWLVDFGYAEMQAGPELLLEDVIEALVSLAVRFGADEIVATATEVLGHARVREALEARDRARWTPGTGAELRDHPEVLDQLVAAFGRTAQPRTEPA